MTVIHLTVFSLWLALSSSYHLPKTSPGYKTKGPEMPANVQAQGHRFVPELRIPNEKFCRNMQLQPYRHYMILPWWYVHCERIMEKEERLFRESKKLLPIYGRILKLVQQYKKKQAHMQAVQNSFYGGFHFQQ